MLDTNSHSLFLDMLTRNDKNLCRVDINYLKNKLYRATGFKEEGLWTRKLADYISKTTPSQLPYLEWVTEKHYAEKLRDPEMTKYHDHLYLLGYARVISIRMRYISRMGYSEDDLHFVLDVLRKYYSGNRGAVRLLEVGCGTGELLTELYTRGYLRVEGIDISPAAIRMAKRRLRKYREIADELYCLSLDDFRDTYPNTQYDIVYHSDVIEHIPPHQTYDFLKTIHSFLKPEGHLIVMTPSALTGPHDSTRLFEPSTPKPQGFHFQEFLLSKLKGILSQAGFGHFETVGSLPSLNGYWDFISEENFRFKLDVEECLLSTDWRLRKPLVDGMYFKGLVCQKLA